VAGGLRLGGGLCFTNAVSLRFISRATFARNASGGNPSFPASAVRAGMHPYVHFTSWFAGFSCFFRVSSAEAVSSLGKITTAAGLPPNFTLVNASTVTYGSVEGGVDIADDAPEEGPRRARAKFEIPEES